jgi:hypothetical protein
MSKILPRREALKRLGLMVGAVVGLGSKPESWIQPASAAELPRLSPQDPMAQALNYHEDATTVDPKQFPAYTPDQKCSSCGQLQGQDGDQWRPCALFPNALVNANGWCRAWTAANSGPD